LLDLRALQEVSDQADGFRRRDEIKQIIAQRLKQHTTEHWLKILNAADIWCAEVLDWPKLCASTAFEQLGMLQTLRDGHGIEILTTRLPIRVDGGLLTSERLAPRVGQHTETIQKEFRL
jgi:CoA:oxalate CoA-transferase